MSSPIPAINEQLLIPSCLKFSLGFVTARSVLSLAGETPHWNSPQIASVGWERQAHPMENLPVSLF